MTNTTTTTMPPPAAPGGGAQETTTMILQDPVEETIRLVERAREQGLVLRVIGGLAIVLQTRELRAIHPRVDPDLDLVAPARTGRRVAEVLDASGYVGDEHFNARRGDRRLAYHDPVHGRKVDVFIGSFEMCHPIPVTDRLERDPVTVPREELLLSKLQIIELNEKDVRDIYALVCSYPVEQAGDGIDPRWIAGQCAASWGLHHTVELNLARLADEGFLHLLEAHEHELVRDRLAELGRVLDAEPKGARWRARARVGERMRWYEEPEDLG